MSLRRSRTRSGQRRIVLLDRGFVAHGELSHIMSAFSTLSNLLSYLLTS
jgi:hypothetical protein